MDVAPERIAEFLSRRERKEIADPKLLRAGVLILLFRKKGKLHVLLTKRSALVEHHKGQISFPGGSMDAGDPDIIATAVRETEEEIGLSPTTIRILGLFDDVWTPSGFRVTPVVAYMDSPPKVRLSPEEVEKTMDVPLAFFLDSGNERVERFIRGGQPIDVYFYRYAGAEIWGATASMLRSFLHALRSNLGG